MAYKVKLTEKQRKELIEVVIRNGKHQAKVIMHANIMLQAWRRRGTLNNAML